MKHAAVMDDPPNARWCAFCREAHGLLYACEHFSPKLRAKIAGLTEALRLLISDEDLMDASRREMRLPFRPMPMPRRGARPRS